MSMPYYVSPEQAMKDRADFARKGIARGRSLIGMSTVDGIVIVAENHSRTLHKVSEIYDRIAFAAVGRYNEFDQLRIAGVRAADLRGYSYSREDVEARSLANAYAQMLGQVFTHEMKPLEVEILVAEVGRAADGADDRMYHILYDGTVMDEEGLTVLGGDAETIVTRARTGYREGIGRDDAIRTAVAALAGDRALGPRELEVAALARQNGRRTFRRIEGEQLAAILGVTAAPAGTTEPDAP